ncbi:MAG TPA: DmsC/YnfH family molybdoenzyme membrane anchor subunit [Stellaceae bacterium]|nr:DmsC/YnfH family molybdoenzyme membrane anchor subunit [Stellaceae bacterium]
MHPALSIVFFTTASGAGFSLLFLLGVGGPLDLLPLSRGFGFAALALAAFLAAAGLASSAFHLGRPERAWRAFSQWRSSWLSREGVFSILTFLPAAVYGIGWVSFGIRSGLVGLCGILAGALAAVTIYCTGMIYASLRPIHQWHNPWVVSNYFALGLMSALLILDFLVRLWEPGAPGVAVATAILVIVAWLLKERYWRSIDTTSASSTVASATLLGSRGKVRMLEPPHTEENYLLKEMGFAIARKHRARLRGIVRLAGFALPGFLTLLALLVGGLVGMVAAGLAVAVAGLGLVAERWLFFAEAKHTVMLYYGVEAV